MSIFIGISLVAVFSYCLWKRFNTAQKDTKSTPQKPPSNIHDDGFYCLRTVSGHCKSGYITKENKASNN